MTKLTIEQWKEIRELLKKDKRNISEISRKYKISRHSIYNYANSRGWLEGKKHSTMARNEGFFEKLIKKWGKFKFNGK